jgi:hypothetical protein
MEAVWSVVDDATCSREENEEIEIQEKEHWKQIALELLTSLLGTEEGLVKLVDYWMRNCEQLDMESESVEKIVHQILTIFLLLLETPFCLSVIVERQDVGQHDIRKHWRGRSNSSLSSSGDNNNNNGRGRGERGVVAHSERLRLFEDYGWADIPHALLSEREAALLSQLLHGRVAGTPVFQLQECRFPTSDIWTYQEFMFNADLQAEIIADRPATIAWITYKLLDQARECDIFEFMQSICVSILAVLSEHHPILLQVVDQLTAKSVNGFELQPVIIKCCPEYEKTGSCFCKQTQTLWKLRPVPGIKLRYTLRNALEYFSEKHSAFL